MKIWSWILGSNQTIKIHRQAFARWRNYIPSSPSNQMMFSPSISCNVFNTGGKGLLVSHSGCNQKPAELLNATGLARRA